MTLIATDPTALKADVAILGGGLAGLTLARHLLLHTDRSVVLLEKRAEPGRHQKVGESTVQVGAFYLSRVLDLEHYLFHEHLPKYNLRFCWPSSSGDPADYLSYTQAYLRNFSNVQCYQVDRNRLEADLLEMLQQDPRFRLVRPLPDLDVDLGTPHTLRWTGGSCEAGWLVDGSGRQGFLARRQGMRSPGEVRHGAAYMWVEGTLDVERLTPAPRAEVLRHPSRRQVGHLPQWLATNHFMGPGFWFWVIPLKGKTSLGLVYDRELFPGGYEVGSAERLTAWISERFPLFAEDLRHRRIEDFGFLKDFGFDCRTTLSPERWALTGEAGRYADPLYSPGTDFIALHNTCIVEAIRNPGSLELSEAFLKAVYEGLVPAYGPGYHALGEPSAFVLKYAWELGIYFATLVFPFLNGLFPQRQFVLRWLARFSRLGKVNAGLQRYLSDYTRWRAGKPAPQAWFELSQLAPLARAERTFYEVGVDEDRAAAILDEQIDSLLELARFAVAWIDSDVLDRPDLLHSRAYAEERDLSALVFDPAAMAARAAMAAPGGAVWTFDPAVMDALRSPR